MIRAASSVGSRVNLYNYHSIPQIPRSLHLTLRLCLALVLGVESLSISAYLWSYTSKGNGLWSIELERNKRITRDRYMISRRLSWLLKVVVWVTFFRKLSVEPRGYFANFIVEWDAVTLGSFYSSVQYEVFSVIMFCMLCILSFYCQQLVGNNAPLCYPGEFPSGLYLGNSFNIHWGHHKKTPHL